jgi:hypothetical protein
MEGQPSRPNQLITTCGGGDRERNRENSPERPIVEESRLPALSSSSVAATRPWPSPRAPVAVTASACGCRRERLWPPVRASTRVWPPVRASTRVWPPARASPRDGWGAVDWGMAEWGAVN